MIIQRITIRDWRGLEQFDAELSSGLNILRGRNEAGKSTVVEALNWALHRDLVGGSRLKDEIAPIIPAHNPKAKPLVELQIEFPDCSVGIRKTLSEDSASRECCLIVRREGFADQTFDQGAAQNELKRLMASDGAANNPTNLGVDTSLLVSAQGQSTRFVGHELSNAARASIALGEDGALAATSRLEKVRSALEKKRSKELFTKLAGNAVDAAKKTTDAARVRDELAELRQEHAKYSAIEAQIGALRAEIKNINERYAQVAPRAENASKELVELRARREAQMKADADVAEKRRAHDETKARRDNALAQIEEIANLRAESTRLGEQVQHLQEQLDTARENAQAWKEKVEESWRAKEDAERDWTQARERLQAWERYQEVCSASRERKLWRERVALLENAAREIEEQKSALEKIGRAPTHAQLRLWSDQFSSIENARRMAAQTLKITVQFERDFDGSFRADDGAEQNFSAGAGEEITLNASAFGALNFPGTARVFIAGADKEAQKQSAQIYQKVRALEKELAPFGVAITDLPGAFVLLEERAHALESASQQLHFMEQTQKQQSGENLEDARAELLAAEEIFIAARQACEPFRAFIPEGVKTSQANIERERARDAELQEQQSAESARRTWTKNMAAQNEFSKTESDSAARLQVLEERARHNAARLTELESDGFDDAARAARLEKIGDEWWQTKAARDEAIRAREALGAPVTTEVLLHLEHEAKTLKEEQFSLEKNVAARRAELKMHCEQDPQTEMDRLAFEIETRQEEITRHEARLRGVAILEGALESERHRLGRAIAAPLNEYLSPWLSELRNKPTRVEFDEDTGKILGVQTKTKTASGESTQVLPFGSHSGGMQEQTALALRLILAQAAAKKLPSQKLPLILDDPLTQTDSQRREGLWRVLHQAAKYLQIVFVTCHETHLPKSAAHFVTLGDWQIETPIPETKAQIEKPKRAKKVKAETNGHAPEKIETESLALW